MNDIKLGKLFLFYKNYAIVSNITTKLVITSVQTYNSSLEYPELLL